MQTKRFLWVAATCLTTQLLTDLPGQAQVTAPDASEQRRARGGEGDFAAARLLDRAVELLQSGEEDRGVKMIETVIEQYPQSQVRFKAWLALGKHYLEAHNNSQALAALRNLKAMDAGEAQLTGDAREVFLEGLYLQGISHFQMKQFATAFPIFRRITNNYPNTIWANQAYFYIGMCHFATSNWNKAIEALSLVGTFVDPESPTIEFVEAGRRFYVKIDDADLPILYLQGKTVSASITTAKGDQETISATPLPGGGNLFIASIATVIGAPKPGDGVLQVRGGDTITTAYVDENAQDGSKNVKRESTTRVVSSGVVEFTLGNYQDAAGAGYIDQPLFVLLSDADLDITNAADRAEVRLISRYTLSDEESEQARQQSGDLQQMFSEQERFRVRDEVLLGLTELGEGQLIASGKFGGNLQLIAHKEGQPVDRTDTNLSVEVDDEIVVTYGDALHVMGSQARDATALLKVVGEIDSRPRATQNVVFDPVVRARKNLVESSAFLELARIFKSMGLVKGAREKAGEGLERVEQVIREAAPIPSSIKEEAFKNKWELHIAVEDFAQAIATCRVFNELYPQSTFVDQALMEIGKIKMEAEQYDDAIGVFQQILTLRQSGAKAEAQYRIAEATERRYGDKLTQIAIQAYKQCAERFPESEWAGASLAKVVDYYIEEKDYARADELLTQIFQDYPDAAFLDSMLLKWVMVAFRMNDFPKAYEKCQQLLFEYPGTQYAERAQQILPRIEQRIKK